MEIEEVITEALSEEVELPEPRKDEIFNNIFEKYQTIPSKINYSCERKTCWQNDKGICKVELEPETCNNYDHEIYFRHIKK